jgi:glyceraldehyde-3-phosphate dehydrogenase (NAD(P))
VEAGTDDGATAQAMLKGAGVDVPVFASTVQLNHQLLHALHFSIRVADPLGTADALARLQAHARAALTDKLSANPVFSFGRDHGHAGRLLNALVVPRGAVAVRPGHEVVGFAWLPPDGCELYTTVALILWMLDGEAGLKRLGALKPYLFEDV